MPSSESRSVEATPSTLVRDGCPQVPAPTLVPSRGKLLGQIIGVVASCAVLVSLSVWLVDRPVSTWVHEHLGDSHFAFFRMSYDTHSLAIGPFTLMAGLAEAVVRAAPFVPAVLAAAAVVGRPPERRGRIILVLSLAILFAGEINQDLKWAFGRTWPENWLGSNPSWIGDGVFGFFPFHGGSGWGSFPSGHTTVITTLATLLWLIWPQLRVLWVAMVALVITGLIGANYHFVSDIIGGLYLGVAIGLGTARLVLSPKTRFGRSILRVPTSRSEQHLHAIDPEPLRADHVTD